MKRIIASLFTALFFVICNISLCGTAYADNLNIDAGDVEFVYFERYGGNGFPRIADEDYKKTHFSFTTNSRYDIEYIMHYLNSLDLEDDGKILSGNDIVITNLEIKTRENVFDTGFVTDRFCAPDNKQYGVNMVEYDRFIEFMYALYTGKTKLDKSSVLGASEWAEEYICRAIESDLVPEWNQIGYRCDITRLEVCQLIDSFLTMNNYTAETDNTVTFCDATDPSINLLRGYDIIEGKDTDNFYPYDNLTREEFAKILSKTYHFMNKGSVSRETDKKYADNASISEWAKPYVEDMTGAGMLMGEDNGYFNPKGKVTKEQVIVTLLRLNTVIDRQAVNMETIDI